MADTVMCPENFVFGLDIGTRSIVGTIGYMDSHGFHVIAMEVKEHDTRAMLDGQVHDISKVGEEIQMVKSALEIKIGRPLKNVCIAAAGRVLRTITVKSEKTFEEETKVSSEDIYNLDLSGVELAHRKINEKESRINFYCVGYTPIKYYLNDYEIGNLENHKAEKIAVDLIATFLPEEVIDGLYSAVEFAGLEVANLTLEPIAAMNVAIPEQYRLLNIALVDVGAGTSDICITKDGSIIAYGMIPAAGDEISEIIAKTYLVDFTRADKIKIDSTKKKSVTFKDVMGIKQTIKSEDIIKLTSSVTTRIADEVGDKIIELNGGRPVSAVFVVGGGGKIPGFTSTLASKLKLPEQRVAIRGREVLENIEFAVNNVKKDSLYVTPVGICINYYNQKNNFIYVTVNGERIKLYDNEKLSVIDAIIQAGYPNEKLFPRRGTAVNYTINGQARLIRGLQGEPAHIYKNGKDSNMHASLEKNDYIDIEESTIGETVETRICELPEFKSDIIFIVNDKKIICPKYAYVNNKPVSGEYIIKNEDSIVMENYYTVKQIFEFMDINTDDFEILVNNESATENTKVYENFSVKYKEIKNTEALDVIDEIKENENQASLTIEIRVLINNREVTLSGKKEYKFVDIFDFYPFDLSKAEGTDLITNVNGVKADFMGSIKDGDIIELYWKK